MSETRSDSITLKKRVLDPLSIAVMSTILVDDAQVLGEARERPMSLR